MEPQVPNKDIVALVEKQSSERTIIQTTIAKLVDNNQSGHTEINKAGNKVGGPQSLDATNSMDPSLFGVTPMTPHKNNREQNNHHFVIKAVPNRNIGKHRRPHQGNEVKSIYD